MGENFLVATLLLSPLLGFLINGFNYKKWNCKVSGTLATFAVAISFLCSLVLVGKLIGMPEDSRIIRAHFFNWISIGSFQADAAFVIDQISAIMLLVITGVGSLIHLFSIGYMSHDERPAKYFSYLNFFLFNMLLLVLGDNLLVMFVGWEGVGLCSYLLIGFWFTDKEKAAAGMKAFITNRIGDAGFLIGMFILFLHFGTVSFTGLNEAAPSVPSMGWFDPVTLACLFLFIGATGKSAQIPLYVWLPDAMAGPTPVSALIHAATMVTAGVYMIVRLNPIFIMAPNAMFVIACVGALTAVLAATIGLTQWDIKKVLAYSTVSQLGYMFLGVGVGAFGAAMFHLMTHAFFKALMFLGSGSVIHAMHEEQDIRKMGALKKLMPITHFTFLLGWLAIIGVPPFAGFFSKDEILWMSFHSPMGSTFLWFLGVVGAGCTAFYMTRLMALTFWGKSRVPSEVHPHESPRTMTIPLIVLGVLSVIGGWIGIPHVIGAVLPGHPGNVLEHWLAPRIASIPEILPANEVMEWSLMGVSVSIAGVSAWLAYRFYIIDTHIPEKISQRMKGVYSLVYNKYWVDEIYFSRMINPLIEVSKNLWFHVDVNFIDKMTYFCADIVKGAGSAMKSLQNGNLQQYAMYVAIGIVFILSFVLRGL